VSPAAASALITARIHAPGAECGAVCGAAPMSGEVPAGLCVLMTLDAVGGVWRYAMDLAAGLRASGLRIAFLGFGPAPSASQRHEAQRLGPLDWSQAPLDWMARDEAALRLVPRDIATAARTHAADLIHLNLPSQAAALEVEVPVLVVSHSCVVTWFAAVRGQRVPPDWQWQKRLTLAGLRRADLAVVPSHSQALLMQNAYGHLPGLRVVWNASATRPAVTAHEPFVLAMGRWWDAGKNAAVLDRAAQHLDGAEDWPVVMLGAGTAPTGEAIALHHADHRGEVPHDVAAALLARSGLFVSPSVYEPFGLAALEAAQTAVPLVLADIPTYRELWDGAAAFFAPDDAGALAALLRGLSRDPAARRRLGAAASARAARYSLGAQTARMRAHYGALCAAASLSRHARAR
jgi:glycosyltransferase involved in cell wall biosynthesis